MEQQDIRLCWDQIKPGLEFTQKKISAPWRPEDIYSACVSGQASLYTGETGFVVVQPQHNNLDGSPELLVWVAYAEGQGNIERHQEAVDKLARDYGFARLVFWSNRTGFIKLPGWTPTAMVYVREL